MYTEILYEREVLLMGTAKRTYALPSQTLKRFEQEIAPGKRSAKVAELIEGWIREREREALRQNIIEGCHEMNELLLEIAREWEGADDELWRTLEP
jgi:hypothetical protein